MQIPSLFVRALLSVALLCRRASLCAGKAHRVVGQGLLQGRGRCAVRSHQEVRGQEQGHQVELSQYPIQDMIPKTVSGARFRQPARRGVCRRLRLPGHGEVGVRRQARRHHQRDRAAARALRAGRVVDHVPLQRQDEGPCVLRVPDQAADACTSSTGRTCWPTRASRKATSRRIWKGYWNFWCDKVQPAYRQKSGNRAFGIGMPLGVDSSDSFFSFLTFMDGYNVKLVNDSGKLLVDDPRGAPGPDQRAHRLHGRLLQGLLAAVVDQLEGPRQQRRLPQQDHRDDAQRDDLDRRRSGSTT